jgi:hypothetical protein
MRAGALLLLLASAAGEGSGYIPDRGDIAGHIESASERYENTIAPDDSLWGEDGSRTDGCYETDCHPDYRYSDGPINCDRCPQKEYPSTWAGSEPGDEAVKIALSCQTGSAVMAFNLSRLLDLKEPWIDNTWTLAVSGKSNADGVGEITPVTVGDLTTESSAQLKGLCASVQYDVCLELTNKNNLNLNTTFCQVSFIVSWHS